MEFPSRFVMPVVVPFVMPVAALLTAAPAAAQDAPFCADRPGLGTPACSLPRGDTVLEVTGLTFERGDDGETATRTTTIADTLVRHGIGADTEIQFGIMGHVRTVEDEGAGGGGDGRGETRISGLGDSYVALRHGLFGPDGPAAIQVYVTLPTGAEGTGAGTWGAGLVAPVDLTELAGIAFALTPEVSASPNETGDGRHLTYGLVLGGSAKLGRGLSGGLEISAFQDDEPGRPQFKSELAATLVWIAFPRLQFNAEFDAGLAGTPATAFRLGFALQL